VSLKTKLTQKNEDDVFDLFKKKKRLTVKEICAATGCSESVIKSAIESLLARGVMIHLRSGAWVLDKEPVAGANNDFVFLSDKDGRYKFGFYSDQHLCSKYARLDVGEDLHDKFVNEGVKHVLNAGNWIDGEARFNNHDRLVHGCNEQCQYLAENYPQRKGITTYAVAGDDHEGWYNQQLGIDIGKYAESVMRENGRKDWVNLGYMECFVTLQHRESGKKCKVAVMHPGGGSAYAVSYKPQKIAEGFSGGDKPAAMLIGHYHKMSYNLTRSIHAVQCGTGEDQTTYMRKKGLDAHVGGGIVEFRQDPRTGALISCRPEFFQYFVKGYYNNRWSHSGKVTHANRM
jgi:hypothetical protein